MSSIANQCNVEGLGDLLVNETTVTNSSSAQKIYTATKRCRIFLIGKRTVAGYLHIRINATASSSANNNDVYPLYSANASVDLGFYVTDNYFANNLSKNLVSLGNNCISIDLDANDYISVLCSGSNELKYKVYGLNN